MCVPGGGSSPAWSCTFPASVPLSPAPPASSPWGQWAAQRVLSSRGGFPGQQGKLRAARAAAAAWHWPPESGGKTREWGSRTHHRPIYFSTLEVHFSQKAIQIVFLEQRIQTSASTASKPEPVLLTFRWIITGWRSDTCPTYRTVPMKWWWWWRWWW